MTIKITVSYSCHLCGLDRVPVEVTARTEENLKQWMDDLIHLLATDHHNKSPFCDPDCLSNIMIPITGTDRVGGPVLN